MRCEQFNTIISAFVDSEANALEAKALQEHVKHCELCKNELASQYTLSWMVKDCHSSSDDCSVDLSASVMSKITGRHEIDSMLDRAVGDDCVIAAHTSRFKYIAAGFVCAITAAAVFSANSINSHMTANAIEEYEYTSYIYEHLNTPNYEPNIDYASSGEMQLDKVSFIK